MTRRLRSLSVLALVVLLGACARRTASPGPPLGAAPGFALVDQAGTPLTAESLRGRTWAAAFLFTRCPTVCPELVRAMRSVGDEARQRGIRLNFVAFSVDPEHDTPPVLAAYAQAHGLDSATYSLVTGPQATIEQVAAGFKVALEGRADARAENYGITHGVHLVLVDPALRVRGYYRVSEPAERQRLLADAVRVGQ